MALFKDSRFLKTSAYNRRGETLILNIRKRAKFNLEDATYYTFIQGDTLDGIAYKTYENAQLWWAILDANPQYQSEAEINVGDILAIPSFEQVVRLSG